MNKASSMDASRRANTRLALQCFVSFVRPITEYTREYVNSLAGDGIGYHARAGAAPKRPEMSAVGLSFEMGEVYRDNEPTLFVGNISASSFILRCTHHRASKTTLRRKQ